MYTYKVKNQTLQVIKFTTDENETMWRFEVNSGGSDDWFYTKRAAKYSGVTFINENF